MDTTNLIALEDALRKCKSRTHFYRGMIEKGYFLPRCSSNFCAFVVLREILNGKCWCPRQEQVHHIQVRHPPKNEELLADVQRAIEHSPMQRNFEESRKVDRFCVFLTRYKPEKIYLLGVLSVFAPKADCFKVGYRPLSLFKEPVMVPHSNFFNDMPELAPKELRKPASISFLTREEKADNELARLLKLSKQVEQRVQRQQGLVDKLHRQDPDDDYEVKISLVDMELLRQAKLHRQLLADAQRNNANPLRAGSSAEEGSLRDTSAKQEPA